MIKGSLGGNPFLIPQSYPELTLGQFYELRKTKEDSIIEILSILTGLSVDYLRQSDKNLDDIFEPALDWMREEFDFTSLVLPSSINIVSSEHPKGKNYPVPSGLGIKTFGQKIEFEKKAKEGISEIDLMEYALAIYFQPEITGKPFDPDQMNKTLVDIRQCSVMEAWPVASFFLQNWQEYYKQKAKGLDMNQAPKREGLIFQSCKPLKNSGLSTPLRKVLINLTMKFLRWIITPSSLRSGMKKNSVNIKNGTTKY